ncbi:uncharacterized protein LOC126683440 [Mercurialis annua]|uniref:uncharacterized protein LOC126683440 n=1 Tax=Mercurialis annua TaxID=3986 RepID=UPI0021607BB5|nr:uncharacterized protein LOC126683440 [Mercurialis annua]
MSNKNCSIKPRKSKTPARKSRSKTRKPKYLSLKLQLSPKSNHPQHKKTKQKIKIMPPQPQQKQLINLFPLHPENNNNNNNLVPQDQEQHVHHHHHDHDQADHVAFLFQTATDDSSTSLHAILDSATTTSDEGSIPVVPWADLHRSRNENDDQEEGLSLVKTAMKRCKERDVSEERWVSYCEVVEKKEQEEVSSTTVNCCHGVADTLKKMVMQQIGDGDEKMIGLVGLKLDYEEIMNAWSDKGPLYINGGDGDQSPQIVPDLLHASTGLTDGWGNVWKVPEMGIQKEKEEWKLGQREASVLRYKEKRQNRLFSKKIRYQVRKLNAQKRPRFKGRFVKRNEEE